MEVCYGKTQDRWQRRQKYYLRSIWSAKYFLEAALHWHIGNGRSMKIWKDIWIPRPYSYKPISVTKFLHADAKVFSR
ncbi:unnamed protein product [Camellia sinensis]